ncbi:hypothetical protein IL54_1642 [Sphingobium sp. ba1]|nr:hypothetical protein [Sphingobium sp. ba1]KFL46226.1 hypothetical protein IL54_1642 [Sphingobium sp. ba1]
MSAPIEAAPEAAQAVNRAWIAGTIATTRQLVADPELLRSIERRGF